jgi:hypothetical protein
MAAADDDRAGVVEHRGQRVDSAAKAAECPRKRSEKAIIIIPKTIAYALISQTSASAPASGYQIIKMPKRIEAIPPVMSQNSLVKCERK